MDSETEQMFISIVTDTTFLATSTDWDSEISSFYIRLLSPDTSDDLWHLKRKIHSGKMKMELVSVTRQISDIRDLCLEQKLFSLISQTFSLIIQIISLVRSMDLDSQSELISLVKQVISLFNSKPDSESENHEEYEKAPVQTKHPLHPHHSLQLVIEIDHWYNIRECYCCDKDLEYIFYHCQACDYAMNFACAEKRPLFLSIDHPKRHEHPVSLFPSHDSLTCHACSIKDSRCLFYVCLPCGFVVHQKCISLPYVIKISRHPHRISFTHSFDKGDWFCSVCRKKINNDYGGYSCIKDGCLYAVHSRCATQGNVWDGIELEGVPEESEEVLEPFVRIGDGIIEHFSHQHHHLRLVENTDGEYDEKKLCQTCIVPIYFGNFYSCVTCEFIVHEECANLSRKIHHAIHPHIVTLVGGYDGLMDFDDKCSACGLECTCGAFYKCGKGECDSFRLHVQCATISEPLVHGSHMHPLFLTSKPGEGRTCSICEYYFDETFNCIEDCDVSLCFKCATIPQKVRYKHDKHILFLTYGEETSTVKNWCETCEKKINPKERFYKCDEYCCVTLHIQCLIGKDLYMKPGSSFAYINGHGVILANNQHMSRPICSECEMRCLFPVVFQCSELIFCSIDCIPAY